MLALITECGSSSVPLNYNYIQFIFSNDGVLQLIYYEMMASK